VEVYRSENVLVGYETADDAGVYLLDGHIAAATGSAALVQTVDFFTPIVDDPYVFGQIAAANALSDIYAMGAKPLFALNIVGFPKAQLPIEVLRETLAGGAAKMAEAKVSILGGHSVQDQEFKFGYAVTGICRPDRVYTNRTAQPGDTLVLTKPLGSGVVATGIKRGLTPPEVAAAAIEWMLRLNQAPSAALEGLSAHAVTDVTGYGLLGHAHEVATGSRVTIHIATSAVPLMPGVLELARQGCFAGAVQANRRMVAATTDWNGVDLVLQELLLDPQTSGGLLISLPPTDATRLEPRLVGAGHAAARVGIVKEFDGHSLRLA
jgi:selenide,water dikinase